MSASEEWSIYVRADLACDGTGLYLLFAKRALHETEGYVRAVPSLLQHQACAVVMETMPTFEDNARRCAQAIHEADHTEIVTILAGT